MAGTLRYAAGETAADGGGEEGEFFDADFLLTVRRDVFLDGEVLEAFLEEGDEGAGGEGGVDGG